MKRNLICNIQAAQQWMGIIVLIVSGFVIQWWTLPGAALFCLGLFLLCLVALEEDMNSKRTYESEACHMFKAKKILVPIDFSKESELALEWAVMTAKENPDSSIELLHVLPNLIMTGGPESMGIDYVSIYEKEEKASKTKLRRIEREIPGGIAAVCAVSRGSIAEEVEKLCKRESIDLVVMTTHGRKGLSHLLHGSTTEETARLAPCPVLVLHLNEITREVVGANSTAVGES